MYTHLRKRSEASLEELCQAFEEYTRERRGGGEMAHLAHRAHTTSDLYTYHSTASAPSLRSKEPVEIMERPFTPIDDGGGNVKVVVRVRKFVKRGERLSFAKWPSCMLMDV